MASRRNIQHEGRSAHDQGMTHRSSSSAAYHPTEQLSQSFLEKKYVSQAEELESLLADNRKLASANMALQEDYVAAQQQLEKLRQHIKSTQTEGDIQIRILLDKIAKWEADIRAGERVKKDLQQAHLEVRSLVAQKQELTGKISKSTQELEKAREELKKLPEMNGHLESLKQEHQRLRKTFQYEKGLNTEKVEQMKMEEKELIGMAEELERLRAAVANAKKKAQGPTPYAGPYMNPNTSYPEPMNSNVGFINTYGTRQYVGGGTVGKGMVPSGSASNPAANPATAAYPAQGGSYDASHI